MTPIRALFFLAAITAACAARIPQQAQETRSLETQIALLASHRPTGNPIDNGIDKFKELVRKIKARIEEAEAKLIEALESSGSAVAKKINEFILNKTGVDLKLDEKLEALEKKTEVCLSQFKVSLKDVVDEIKTDTETCAATQVADAKDIIAKIQELIKVLEVVPKTIADIKACAAGPTTPAPAEPTTAEPTTDDDAETDAPTTEAAATTSDPQTVAPADDSDDAPVALRRHQVGSISDFWRTVKCVSKELAAVSKDLAEVPQLLENVLKDVKDLSSPENRQALEKCAVQTVAGKAPEVQTAAAQLAYCVIAPASKQ